MKLRAITVNNVRRFTVPFGVSDIGDGLNVLSEPNENGKSTLFDAIQALFFKAHGARDREIMALKPHAGGAPEVTVEVETPEGRFVIAKRWTSRPQATVHRAGVLIAQADVAEAWIARLVGGSAGGPSGLVWVRQGLTGLTAGSAREQAAALEARRDLMSSVSDEVEAMTGGRRMDAALARCKAELAALATGTGQKKAGGAWRAAADRVEALQAQQTDLRATAAALHAALDDRQHKRRALAEVASPDVAKARTDRLDAATQAHRVAEQHAALIETAARKVSAARLAVTAALSRRDALHAAQTEHDDATRQATAAHAARDAAHVALATARDGLTHADAAVDMAQTALTTAEAMQRQVERQRAAQDGAARRADLVQRIADAETARSIIEAHAAAAQAGPDRAEVQKLDALATTLATARARRDAMAVQVVVTYRTDPRDRVSMDGVALADGKAYPIPQGAILSIEGLADIAVRPGAKAPDSDSVGQAERNLARALLTFDLPDVAAAHRAADARATAATLTGEARARLDSLAPHGIDPLRETLAAIPAPVMATDLLDPQAVAKALHEARDVLTAAQATHRHAAEVMTRAREGIAGTQAEAAAGADRLTRATVGLAGFGDATLPLLTEEVRQATAALDAAEAIHAEQIRNAPDLTAAAAALSRARSIEAAARDEIARLRPEIARLDERIASGSGDAVEERLAECDHALIAAAALLDRYTRQVAVLQRLERALIDARVAAREKYFAPVAAELKPLLHLLWPDAELTWTQDTLLPESLIRNGQTEPLDILSGGTQEQIALLVRLAFARMLERDGRHAPVLLDDALVFTDDDRIERMFDALHRQAGDLQIIVLTCRQRAFRDLGGQRLRLTRQGDDDAGDVP